MRKTVLSRNEIQSVTIVTNQKEFYSYDASSGRANIEELIPYDEILPLARLSRGRSIWYADPQGEQVNIYYARIINDRDSFEEIGFMAILISLDDLFATSELASSQMNGRIAIMNPQGSMLYQSKVGSAPLLSEMDFSDAVAGSFYVENQERYLVNYQRLEDPEWLLYSTIDEAVIKNDILDLRNWVVSILIPMTMVLIAMTFYLSSDFVNPIYILVDAMKELKKGQKPKPICLYRNDELGYLAENFNEMSHEIDHLVNDVYREQIMRKEVELKALQAQINPHFLFNTLETINWMAQLKKSARNKQNGYVIIFLNGSKYWKR